MQMKNFINLPHHSKEEMGLRGRILVEEKFDEKKVLSSILARIKALITKGSNL